MIGEGEDGVGVDPLEERGCSGGGQVAKINHIGTGQRWIARFPRLTASAKNKTVSRDSPIHHLHFDIARERRADELAYSPFPETLVVSYLYISFSWRLPVMLSSCETNLLDPPSLTPSAV